MTYTADSPIMGTGIATAADIQAWLALRAPDGAAYCKLPEAPIPAGFGRAIIEECRLTGINSDLFAAQVAKESAYVQSQIARDKRNYAGLGAVNDNAYGGAITFATPRAGLHAQAAHLLTYIQGAANEWRDDDPRYSATIGSDMFGKARVLCDLEQHWAWSPAEAYASTPPEKRYGAGIANLANQLVSFAQQRQEAMMPYAFVRGLIDIRRDLATNPNAGPGYGIPLAQKAGVIVHYSGPAVDLSRSDRDIIKGEAAYHVSKNWGSSGQWVNGDGYMYHVTIGRNGEKWLCRNLEACLWHCGSWPENETWWSVHVPIGEGQRGTPAQLAALGEVVRDLLASNGLGRDRVKGHQEVDSTACPGSLMDDFVRPYRCGKDAPVPQANSDRRDTATGIPLWHGFKALYEEAERAPNQLGIRLLGAGPICEPFDMAFGDNPGQLYTVQLLERGGGFMYEGGQEEPWRNHGLTTWQVIEAWRFGIKHNKIPEQFIPAHLR